MPGAAGTPGAAGMPGAAGTAGVEGVGSAFAVPIPSPTAVNPKAPANIALAMVCFSFIAHLLVPLTLNVIALTTPTSAKVSLSPIKSKPKFDQDMRSVVAPTGRRRISATLAWLSACNELGATECGAMIYWAPLSVGCRVLGGPAAVR